MEGDDTSRDPGDREQVSRCLQQLAEAERLLSGARLDLQRLSLQLPLPRPAAASGTALTTAAEDRAPVAADAAAFGDHGEANGEVVAESDEKPANKKEPPKPAHILDQVMMNTLQKAEKPKAIGRARSLLGQVLEPTAGHNRGPQWNETNSEQVERELTSHLQKAAGVSWRLRLPLLRPPVLPPSSTFRGWWLFFGFTSILYEAVTIPLNLAFNLGANSTVKAIQTIINIYFICDVPLTCITGYCDVGGKLIMDPWQVLTHYVFSLWFPVDVVTAIPWDWISIGDEASATQLTKVVRMLRFLTILRLAKFKKLREAGVGEKIEVFVEASQVLVWSSGLGKILFLLFIINHWMACMWYGIGNRGAEGRDKTWIQVYIGDRWPDEHKLQRYVYSLFYVLTTMTTVGYGDPAPVNFEEVLFTLMLLLVASIVFAGLLGVLADLIRQIQAESNQKNEQKMILSRYMRWRGVPNELFLDIRRHVLFLWDANEGYETYEEELKARLPPMLKTALCHHIYGNVLGAAPFLAWMREYKVCLKQLATMVQSMFLSKGDHLFRVGQPNEQIYLLLAGSVWLTRNNKLVEEHAHMMKGPTAVAIPRGKMKDQSKPDMPTEPAIHLLQSKKGRRKVAQTMAEDEEDDHFGMSTMEWANAKLQLLDVRQQLAASLIQRRWHRRNERLGRPRREPQGSPASKPHDTASKTVCAPAYFGESCLWMPRDTWTSNDPPKYTYATQCVVPCEFIYITRVVIEELIQRYSPWLGDRFDYFAEAVADSLKEELVKLKKRRRRTKASMSPTSYIVDWEAMDLSMPEEETVPLTGNHCLSLRRGDLLKAAAVASEGEDLPTAVLKRCQDAVAAGMPAMPRKHTATRLGQPTTPRPAAHHINILDAPATPGRAPVHLQHEGPHFGSAIHLNIGGAHHLMGTHHDVLHQDGLHHDGLHHNGLHQDGPHHDAVHHDLSPHPEHRGQTEHNDEPHVADEKRSSACPEHTHIHTSVDACQEAAAREWHLE